MAQRSVCLPRIDSVPVPSGATTKTSRPTLVRENGPGGVSVGELNPIAPPVMVTVVVPSAAKVILPVPAGSWTE